MIYLGLRSEGEILFPDIQIDKLGDYSSGDLAVILMFLMEKTYAETLFEKLKSKLSEDDLYKIGEKLGDLMKDLSNQEEDILLRQAKTPILSAKGEVLEE